MKNRFLFAFVLLICIFTLISCSKRYTLSFKEGTYQTDSIEYDELKLFDTYSLIIKKTDNHDSPSIIYCPADKNYYELFLFGMNNETKTNFDMTELKTYGPGQNMYLADFEFELNEEKYSFYAYLFLEKQNGYAIHLNCSSKDGACGMELVFREKTVE